MRDGPHVLLWLAGADKAVVQAQWEMQVVTQKLQSLSEGGTPSGEPGEQLEECRNDSASLR